MDLLEVNDSMLGEYRNLLPSKGRAIDLPFIVVEKIHNYKYPDRIKVQVLHFKFYLGKKIRSIKVTYLILMY